MLVGPYELVVDCKNKSACGVGKEQAQAGAVEDLKAVTTTEDQADVASQDSTGTTSKKGKQDSTYLLL